VQPSMQAGTRDAFRVPEFGINYQHIPEKK